MKPAWGRRGFLKGAAAGAAALLAPAAVAQEAGQQAAPKRVNQCEVDAEIVRGGQLE